MKPLKNHLAVLCCTCLLFSASILAQSPPEYVIVTKAHADYSYEEGSMDDWIAIEKEYHDKVIMKNEYIVSATVLVHYFTDDNTEVNYITAYNSWGDIEKAQERSSELEKEAWPDEADRKAYFAKQGKYYLDYHSDEILSTVPGTKPVMEEHTEPYIYYVQVYEMASPEDGSSSELHAMHKELMESTAHKNKFLKGVYNARHAWGNNSQDFVVARVYANLEDFPKSADESDALTEAKWPDEAARDAFFDKYNKYFTGVHRDYIYRDVPELAK